MNAVILAAGRGNRMKSITKNIPKCMVKISGKPIIGWVYDALLQAGVSKIYIVAGYKKDVLWNFIKRRYNGDSHMIIQKKLEGTADALSRVDEKYLGDDFLVIASDAIYSSRDIKQLMKKTNSLLYTTQEEDLQSLGTMEMDGNNIIHIHEKSTTPVSNKVNISAYHFTKDTFNYLEDTPFHVEHKEKIITETINNMIRDGHKFTGIEASTWFHLTKKEDIDKVEKRIVWKKRK